MRKIGTLPSASTADRFHQYLLVQGIDNRVDPVDGEWDVWVFNEEQLAQSREEFAAFNADPSAKKYSVKAPPPPKPKPAPVHRPIRPRGSQRTRVTIILSALSVAITLATEFGRNSEMVNQLMLTPPGGNLNTLLHGEFWRLFTPILLHFGPLHLGFNIYLFWILGGVIERMRGSTYMLMLILVLTVFSNLTQYAVAGGGFGGLSGVVYGLFGYLWMRSVLLPDDGFYMPQFVVTQMIFFAILCLTGLLGNVANGAHFGGLAIGMLYGAAPRLWRD